MIRETFEVQVLEGFATVSISVAITTAFVGGDDDLAAGERRIARDEAAEFAVEALRRAVAGNRAEFHGPPVPESRAKTLLGDGPADPAHQEGLLRVQQPTLNRGLRWDEDRRCWVARGRRGAA